MNIYKLNVIYNNQTTFNEAKKLNFMNYFDMFIVQTESFCRHHWKAPALFLLDPGIM